MADEVVLDEEVITTHKKKYEANGAFWKVTYRILSRRSVDLKYWVVREVEFVGFDTNLVDALRSTMADVGEFMTSCNYDLFSIRKFDGERKEKYGD